MELCRVTGGEGVMKETNITQIKICPRCGKVYHESPALSRIDNQTLICPDCGTREALAELEISAEEQDAIIEIIHQHQQRYE